MKLFSKYKDIIFIIVIAILPLLPLLNPGLPITHDGQDHVARIANFYASLSEGNIIPRWAANLNWGFGHPILMFLYPFSSYTTSLFHLLGMSFVDSVKLFFAVCFVLSGVFMYLWVRSFLGVGAGVVASMLYMFAPYRFVDLYVRGAIGEHAAFVFPPLICLFLLKLSKEKNIWCFVGVCISIAGLILAHNAISIMFLPFIFLYGLFLLLYTKGKKEKRSLAIKYAASLVLGFGLSSFFLLPAYFEGKYTLRDVVTAGEALKHFVTFDRLIYGPWSFGGSGLFTTQVGIVNWIVILGSLAVVYYLYKKKEKYFLLFLISLLYFLASIFIMLPVTRPIWESVTTLQKFQFPWRFLSVSIFMAALLGAGIVTVLSKRYKNIFVVFVVLLSLVLTFPYWQPKGYLLKPESFYTSIYESTTDTGESAPIWSVRFMERRPDSHAKVIEGEAQIKEIKRTTTERVYEITPKYRSRILENTLYFPEWSVYIDGKKYEGIQFQDPNYRGLITYWVLPGKHEIKVVFENTKLRDISDIISIVSALLVISLIVVSLKKNANEENR